MALSATLDLSSERVEHPSLWELRVRVVNDGGEAERFSTVAFRGSVAFEVTDADGAPVPLGPPPVPPASDEVAELDPGQALERTFYGDELFADPPPPGRYRVRFAPGPVCSDWVGFTA